MHVRLCHCLTGAVHVFGVLIILGYCSCKCRIEMILTSRGDLGVFRNSKRDVTMPKEFEFQTAKRNCQNPPIELFSKGSKENRWESCQEGQNVRRDIQDTHQGKQIMDVASSADGELGPRNAMSSVIVDPTNLEDDLH